MSNLKVWSAILALKINIYIYIYMWNQTQIMNKMSYVGWIIPQYKDLK